MSKVKLDSDLPIPPFVTSTIEPATVPKSEKLSHSASPSMRHKVKRALSDTALRKFNSEAEQCPYSTSVATYLSYFLLVVYGRVRDFLGKLLCPEDYKQLKVHNGYAPLTNDFESLYTRRLYRRIRDCWHRPITGVPFVRLICWNATVTTITKRLNLLGVPSRCLISLPTITLDLLKAMVQWQILSSIFFGNTLRNWEYAVRNWYFGSTLGVRGAGGAFLG